MSTRSTRGSRVCRSSRFPSRAACGGNAVGSASTSAIRRAGRSSSRRPGFGRVIRSGGSGGSGGSGRSGGSGGSDGSGGSGWFGAAPLMNLRVRVVGRELPGIRFCDRDGSVREPVYLGIQRGREVIEMVPADVAEATFVPEFRVERGIGGAPNFLGPFAQGTAADRFF